MDDAVRAFMETLADPEVESHRCRYWLWDPDRQVFYRDPVLVGFEKLLGEELGIEYDAEDDAPRSAA
jgi:hypothetical protein